MSTFLQEVAERLVRSYGNGLGEVTVIFPNRRAGLFFRESLKQAISTPVWSPKILSFQDFIAYQTEGQVADKLFLTHRLFEVYARVMKTSEGFDRFYYWGQMLLKDFDDIDKYLVNAENLYTNLNRQKQLDLTFDFLLPEQKEIIQKFWQGFEKTKSEEKARFEFVWDRLFKVYHTFIQSLRQEGLAYEGMQYRTVAENIDKITFRGMRGPVVFAGFNALNLAEEKIIGWFVKNRSAEVIWDIDQYYMNNESQEAGNFLRHYKNTTTFGHTFPKDTPAYIQSPDKQIGLIGVPQHVGQAKLVGQKLKALLEANPGIDLRTVAVVLADEALLFPVLHSLPEEIEAINVTMGFPLAYAPVNSLIENILELQRTIRTDPDGHVLYHFKPALAIIKHPLILPQNTDDLEKLAQGIERNNKVFLTHNDLIEDALIRKIFTPASDKLIPYLVSILLDLHSRVDSEESTVEVEYVHHFYQILNRYAELLQVTGQSADVNAFSRLFKQLVRTERLPFTGEPLKGLQIMGVLETRNLDFDHVFVLSMNEDFFPSQGGKHSFIPYNLRRAYGLPNYDQQDAIYAYLFYRLIQRPVKIEFFYNTEGNDLGGEEMSRFLQQLLHESGLDVSTEVLASYAEIDDDREIKIEKDEVVCASLSRYLKTDLHMPQRRLSPSALTTYLDCRLRFYFRYIADLYEKDSLDEDVDSRSLGNVLHHAMEILYLEYLDLKEDDIITKADIKSLKVHIDDAVVKAFRHQFAVDEKRRFYFEGKNIIAREIVKDFMLSILRIDAGYAPFEFIGAEAKYELELTLPSLKNFKNPVVGLRGTIDRLDRKQGSVRLIDYKTGQDKHYFESLEDLFDRKKKNKAAFQTFYYALLYQYHKAPTDTMMPAVFNKDALFLGEGDKVRCFAWK